VTQGPAARGEPEVRLRAEGGPSAVGGTVATDVVVGHGVLARLEALVRERLPRASRLLLVVDEGVAREDVAGRWPARWPLAWGREPGSLALVPAGEASKTRAVHARLEDAVLARGLTRDDAVVAIGGGAALDVAGYAAATARRGVPWVAVPTSVVAQADAALGGKTAVNHARGKNLLGAFHAPALVVADVATLATLSPRDRVAGLAEMWKAGVAGDPALVATLATDGPKPDPAWWTDAVARALAVKARLVEADPRDASVRRALNYGHTVGHALEAVLGNEAMRHGEAVAIGMGVAAQVALARGRVPGAFVEAQDKALVRLGLPVRVPEAAPHDRLLEAAGNDKKRRGGERHVMVLPTGAGLDVVEDVDEREIRVALAERTERRATRGSAGASP
jgi:3-dehydroquinate synthase